MNGDFINTLESDPVTNKKWGIYGNLVKVIPSNNLQLTANWCPRWYVQVTNLDTFDVWQYRMNVSLCFQIANQQQI
jgi:hypothetical protein